MNLPFRFREQVTALVRHHLVPLYLAERDNPGRLAIEVSQTARCDHLAILSEADARGRVVGTAEPTASARELASLMVGRDVRLVVDKEEREAGPVALLERVVVRKLAKCGTATPKMALRSTPTCKSSPACGVVLPPLSVNAHGTETGLMLTLMNVAPAAGLSSVSVPVELHW